VILGRLVLEKGRDHFLSNLLVGLLILSGHLAIRTWYITSAFKMVTVTYDSISEACTGDTRSADVSKNKSV
jgi:hypothetical protein